MADWLAVILAPLLVIGGAVGILAAVSAVLFVFVSFLDWIHDKLGDPGMKLFGYIFMGVTGLGIFAIFTYGVFMMLTGRE